MQKYTDVVLSTSGTPIGGATITVTNYPDGTPATIYASDGGTAVSSVTSDPTGRFAFYAADGHYSITIGGTGLISQTIDDVTLNDPSGEATTAALAGNGGAGIIGWLRSATGAVKRWVSDKLSDRVSVRDFTGDTVDGTTSNQTGIAAAVAYCYANGKELHWPAGTYVSDANIPNFHDVTHSGNGIIKRGIDTWKIAALSGTNILYVATTGSASNDGLTASQPLTLNQSFLALQKWGPQLMQPGIFKIQLAAGTYDGVPRVYGLRSRQRIQIVGPDVGGHPNVPTAIIDGTGSSQQNGMYFQQYMYVYVQDIKFQNWTTISDSNGLSVDQHCNLQTKNVHTANCNYGGINAQSMSYLYMEGGVHNNANYSIRIYSGCTFSIGYNGGASTNRPQIHGARGGYAGIVIYNNSAGHIDHCDIYDCTGSGGAVQIVNQSRVDFVDTAFGAGTANYYNIRMDMSSTYIDNGITFNAATSRSVAAFGGSMSNAKQPYLYFDESTGFWRMGASTSLTPQALLHLKNTDATTVGYNSSVLLALESSTSPYLAFGTNGGSTEGGIMWAKTGQSVQGKFYYNYADDTVRMQLAASGNTYKWGATYYAAPVDVTTDLGSTAFRWKTLYAQNAVFYPPASVTPTVNSTVMLQLTSDTQLTFKVKGSDGVVRSASLTLA